jgi:GDP-L-fucose synthase
MHVENMAAACVYIMNLDEETYCGHTQSMLSHVNVVKGMDCNIRELTETMAKVIGFTENFAFNTMRPDGEPRKLLNYSLLASPGWNVKISFEEWLRETHSWFLHHQGVCRQ